MPTPVPASTDEIMAENNPVALPALRIAATFFLLINLAGGTYFFFNCHRLFDRDQNVDNICSATLFAQEGNTFPGSDTPHLGPLPSDNGRREKVSEISFNSRTDNQRTLRFQKTPAF